MKKTLIVLSGILLLAAYSACGGKKQEPRPNVTVLEKYPDPEPRWLTDPNYKVIRKGGVKMIYFKIEAVRPTLDKAKIEVSFNKNSYLAGMIEQFTSSEMVKAVEGMLNEQGEVDAYFSEIIAAISRNVNVAGAIPTGEYYEKLLEKTPEKDIISYRYVQQFSMEYDLLQQRILQAAQPNIPAIQEKLGRPEEDVAAKLKNQLDQQGE